MMIVGQSAGRDNSIDGRRTLGGPAGPRPAGDEYGQRPVEDRAELILQMNQYGFVRITCVSPRITVADPAANSAEIIHLVSQAADSDVVLFPELCVTGYTCADLFGQSMRFCTRVFVPSCRSPGATAGRPQ